MAPGSKLIVLALVLAPVAALADGTATCPQLCTSLQQQLEYRDKTAEILGKNKAYLDKLDKDDTSKRVKVNSNIVIANLRIETANNTIASVKKDIADKGCATCEPPKGSK
jgi:hypothetical protein